MIAAAYGCARRTEAPVAARRSRAGPIAATSFAALPLRFEENRGQFAARVRFVARDSGLTLFLTDGGAVMRLRPAADPRRAAPVVLEMRVHDGGARARLEARDRLPTRTSYFLGNDPRTWRTDVATFGAVAYRGVRRGVDLVYHGAENGRLEYDFVVAPGASPDLSLDVDGADGLSVAADGALEIRLPGGVLRQLPPVVYQIVDGRRRTLRAAYRILDRARVGFAVAEYDRRRPLVIDPVLLYSTYLGGSGNDFAEYQAAVDGSGSVYVVGYTSSTDFPTASAFASTHGGGTYDGFVAKLTPAGDALAYATYLGGNSEDYAYGVAVDNTGSAIVVGMTTSANFPTKNSLQPYAGSVTNGFDAFVTKLAPAGDALVYSTYLGGHGYDKADCVALDATGAVYVGGVTYSTDFPTANPFQAAFAGGSGVDGFVTKLTAAGDAIAYSTYLGGSQNEYLDGIAVDATGAAVVVGTTASTNFPIANAIQSTLSAADDAYVVKLTPAGSALAYGTYLGGGGEDYAYAVAVDSQGAAYVVGQTASADFPTKNALQATVAGTDAFVTKLAPDGSALVYSTFLGGSTTDWAYGVAVDATGAAYVGGSTLSQDFPVYHAAQSTNAGNFDAFVSKLTPAGDALAYSTYVGGSNGEEIHGVAVDTHGAVYVSGWTYSTNFPTVNAFQSTFGTGSYTSFIAKLGNPPLVITPPTATVPPRGPQAFTAAGGSGSGYAWALTTNASGGSVDSSGHYTAGPTGSVTDVLTLSDDEGATATATITVTAGVTIMPASASVMAGGTVAFSAMGGSGTGFQWTVQSPAAGTIDSATGSYVAGATAATDTVQVVDSLGNTAQATVTITALTPDDLGAATDDLGTVAPDDLAATPPADLGSGGPHHGCSCRMGGAETAPPPVALLLLLLALLCRRSVR